MQRLIVPAQLAPKIIHMALGDATKVMAGVRRHFPSEPVVLIFYLYTKLQP